MQSNYRSFEIYHKNQQQQVKATQLIGQYRTAKIDQGHRSRLENFICRHSSTSKKKTYDDSNSFSKNYNPEVDSESELGTEVIKISLKELDSKLQILRDKSIDSKEDEMSFSIDHRQFESGHSQTSPSVRFLRIPESNSRSSVKELKRNTTISNIPSESNSYYHIMTAKKYSDKLKHLEELTQKLDKRKKALDAQEAAIVKKAEELKNKESEFRDRVLGPDRVRDIERMLRYEELEIKSRLETVIQREIKLEDRERKFKELEDIDSIRRKLVFDSSLLKTPLFSLGNSLAAPLANLSQQESLSKLEEKLRSTTLDLESRTIDLIEKEKSLDTRIDYLDEYEDSLNIKLDYILTREEHLAKNEEVLKIQKSELTHQICRNVVNEVVLSSFQRISANDKDSIRIAQNDQRINVILDKCTSFEGVNSKLVKNNLFLMDELQQKDDEIRRLLDMVDSQNNTSRNREDSLYSDEKSLDEITSNSDLGILQKIKDIREIMNEDNLSIKPEWNNSLQRKRTPEFRVHSDEEFQPNVFINDELDKAEVNFEDSWKYIQFSSELEKTHKTETLLSLMSEIGSLDIRQETDFLDF